MSRFFFDIRDADGLHRDEFGHDLNSLHEAIIQAQSLLPSVARDNAPGGDWQEISCYVRDDTGRVVYQADLIVRGTRLPP